MPRHVFGIRHHGPGSARSLLAALDELRPDAVLIEGPPEAREVLHFVEDEALRPPIALLVYPLDAPEQSVYYPFAEFSPEWQALRWATRNHAPARFVDLPIGIRLRLAEDPEDAKRELDFADDPIGVLSIASGCGDRESWWELQVEQRRDPLGLFDGILEAMTVVREESGPRPLFERRREAWMRRAIRDAEQDGFRRIAVVCGALHAPALVDSRPLQEDEEILRGLGRVAVAATWTPWSYRRLSRRSGYGAGVASPGWYQHLWEAGERAPARWLARAARLLREADLDASAANVIDGLRLAETLAALRDRPAPGIAELNDAVLSVFCHGEGVPMDLIRQDLEIGDRLGTVPEGVPKTPLQRDLEKEQKRLRMKISPQPHSPRPYDLREERGAAKSRLLHRLRILGIPWGTQRESKGRGTFKEAWTLCWRPEFPMRLVDLGDRGPTVEAAAAATLADECARARDLVEIARLLDHAVLSGLPQAIESLLDALRDQAVLDTDVGALLDALPALARVARYGDVRGTDPEPIAAVFGALLERALLRLPGAGLGIDVDAARDLARSLGRGAEALALIDQQPLRVDYENALDRLAEDFEIAPLLRGFACRLLLDRGRSTAETLERRARLALTTHASLDAAHWLEGLLLGGGLAVLHLDELWFALDDRLSRLEEEEFFALLPVLRRAFAGFQKAERRAMGEKARRLPELRAATNSSTAAASESWNERAERVLPILADLLGVER